MLPIILEAAARSLALGLVIGLGGKFLRLTNPHIQMAVWQSVLVASLLMPFLIGWVTFPVSSPGLPIPERLPADLAAFFSMPSPPALLPAAPAASPITQVDWRVTVTWIYVCVAAFLMLRLFIGAGLTWQLCRSATPIYEDWTAGHDVRASPRVNVPITFGSTIVLPQGYADWDAMQRQAVMSHEMSHVSGHDFYILFLAAINRAVFWFSPLAWWLNSRIADLAEARSDAAAIADIKDRVRYAEILLGFGSTTNRAVTALAMARTATVCRRVERILAETMLPKKMSWKAWSLIGACMLPLVAVSVGAVAQTPDTQRSQNAVTPALPSDQGRLNGNTPLPGSEAALRHQIEAFAQGHPDLGVMTEHLAKATLPQVPKIEREFALLGPLQSVSFRGVGFSGWDIYEVKFANGIMISRILLAPDVKISGLLFQWGP